MATDAWEDGYAGSLAADQIDNKAVRELRASRERLYQGGHKMPTPAPGSSTENNDGKHCVGFETGSPAGDAGEWTVWDAAGTTPLFRVYGSTHATKPNQIEVISTHKLIGKNVTSETDPGHLHTRGGTIGGRAGSISTGYLKPTAFRWAKGASGPTTTITLIEARVGSAPSGGSLVIEVRKAPAAVSDGANVYSDAVATQLVGTITITSGNFGASQTSLTNNTMADGDILVLKATTVTGVPADLVVFVKATG